MMTAWGGNHFTPLLLLYRQQEHFSAVAADLLLAFYVVGLVPGFLLSGPLSDRHGRRRLMGYGVAFSIVGNAVLAATPSIVSVLCFGRLLAGAGVAIGMVVGSSWIKELSVAPWDPDASSSAGARRAAMTTTAGFGVGAGVSGVLAQWAPYPTLLPYLVHIALTAVAGGVLLRSPHMGPPGPVHGTLLDDLRIPADVRARFVRVIVPMAPWVFGSCGLGYAVGPALVATHTGGRGIAFATLITVVALTLGAAVQPFAPALGRRTGGRQLLVGLALVIAGTALLIPAATTAGPWWALAAALLVGPGYGLCLVSGLAEVQAMAGPEDLGGLTAIYYSLTYVGFTFPVIIAWAAHAASYGVLLAITTGVCALSLGLVARGLRAR